MKNIIKYTILTALLISGLLFGIGAGAKYFEKYIKMLDLVTSSENTAQHEILNQKIDSLKIAIYDLNKNLDTVKIDIREVKISVDTLKKGQNEIFRAVQLQGSKNLLDYLKF